MYAYIHTITTNIAVRRRFFNYWSYLCVHVNIDKSIRISSCAPSLSVVTLRGRDIVAEFDFSNLSAQLLHSSSFPAPLSPLRLPRGVRHRDSNCSWLGRSPHHDISPKTSGRSHSPSITFSESSLSLSQRKAKVRSRIFLCLFSDLNAREMFL